mmetsp:Transcript_69618/g.193752  ORF Transcript_69618/g.193752 Transcript_69618/m.193752 type:complete len:240 (-) Transcript_69618:6-725(-)
MHQVPRQQAEPCMGHVRQWVTRWPDVWQERVYDEQDRVGKAKHPIGTFSFRVVRCRVRSTNGEVTARFAVQQGHLEAFEFGALPGLEPAVPDQRKGRQRHRSFAAVGHHEGEAVHIEVERHQFKMVLGGEMPKNAFSNRYTQQRLVWRRRIRREQTRLRRMAKNADFLDVSHATSTRLLLGRLVGVLRFARTIHANRQDERPARPAQHDCEDGCKHRRGGVDAATASIPVRSRRCAPKA